MNGGVITVLYLKAESDIPDLTIDFIEVKLKSVQIVALTWDESEFDCKNGQLVARCKGVYFDEEYGNGRLAELEEMKVTHAAICSEYDVDNFKLKELSFLDGKDSLAFFRLGCDSVTSPRTLIKKEELMFTIIDMFGEICIYFASVLPEILSSLFT